MRRSNKWYDRQDFLVARRCSLFTKRHGHIRLPEYSVGGLALLFFLVRMHRSAIFVAHTFEISEAQAKKRIGEVRDLIGILSLVDAELEISKYASIDYLLKGGSLDDEAFQKTKYRRRRLSKREARKRDRKRRKAKRDKFPPKRRSMKRRSIKGGRRSIDFSPGAIRKYIESRGGV